MIYTPLKVRDLMNFDTNKNKMTLSVFSFANSPSLGFDTLFLLNMLNNVNLNVISLKSTKTIKRKPCVYLFYNKSIL